MRSIQTGTTLVVRAIGGLHVVTLAWDFAPGQEGKRTGLLGFAIERSELRAGDVVERYWLRGIKRFEHKDEGVAPGTPLPTSEHPIQSFQWGDYTAKPATAYRYRVVPVYGKPKNMELADASATTVEVETEAERGTIHEIYFNRGVAGSQAYARKFPGMRPDPDQPASEQMKWLSRGLFEALTGFIRHAAGADASDYKLRAMLYEFRYPPVGRAFAAARDAGADVAVRYEAQTYRDENEKMIQDAGIGDICQAQRSRDGIRHNKFIVLVHKDKAVAVWTGSTNVSAGGIFGHSNVGHAVWDEAIARKYLAYWNELSKPAITRKPLVVSNLAAEPTPARGTAPPTGRSLTLFSPRDDEQTVATLEWYGDVVSQAKRVMCMTFAFNLDEIFLHALAEPGEVLRYALFDKAIEQDVEDAVTASGNTTVAAGAKLSDGDLENFLGEKLTGFNRNYYIHDKFILVDPLGDDPVVVTGSANFSRPSQTQNDENMLVIRGDTRVADVYFGEFLRIFDHLYARYVVAKLQRAHRADPGAGYLKEDWAEWVTSNFEPGRKQLRRQYFLGG